MGFASLVAATPARANDPATAQALFDQARKLMTEERWSEACPKLEESQRLDPGGGTVLHLALCREHEGKTATAWAHYQDALAQAKRDGRKDRAKIAQARIDALGPRLPRLRIRVAAPNRPLAGFRVTRDETPVGDAQWGEPIPIDPGPHVLEATADGRRPWRTDIDIPAAAGETSVEVPELASDGSSSGSSRPPGGDDASSRGDLQRTLGLATAGAGAAGLVVGTIFGIISITKSSAADDECQPPDYKLCSAKGVEAGDDAIAAGNVSTVAFVVGGALIAGGAALYFTAPDGKTTLGLRPAAGPRAASLALTGSFW